MAGRRPHRPVVVGVDGSPGAVPAVRAAAREAVRRGVGLELVMAVPRLGWRRHPETTDTELRAAFHEVAGLAVQAAAGAAAAAGVPRLRTRVVDGDPVGVLTAAAASAGLLCIGSPRSGLVHHVLGGGIAGTVAGAARCPVLVVPSAAGSSVDRRSGVLVGVAGGPGDAEAVAEAFAAAADRSTELVAVHAWVAPAGPPGSAHGALEAGRRRGEEVLEDALAPCLASWPSVPVRRVVLHRDAVVTLLGLALTAELVVVGRRRDGSGHCGPVAHALLREAACPVLVVPAA